MSRKVNAPRLKWPKMFAEDGSFTEEYEKYTKDISVCYDLVDIARSILRRPELRLKAGGPRDGIVGASTDGTTIYLPKMHPNRRVAMKHELSHIFFKSNIPLRLAFVQALIRKFTNDQAGLTYDGQVVSDLCLLINVFDDIRVNSLWGLVYPGDGRDMEEWYFGEIGPQMMKKAEQDYKGDISHLFTYAILLCLGQDAKSTKWGKFRDQIVEAKNQVYFKSFKALLLIVRDLLEGILKEIAEEHSQKPVWGGDSGLGLDDEDNLEPDGDDLSGSSAIDDLAKQRLKEEKKKDLASALASLGRDRAPGPDFANDNAGFDHKAPPKSPSAKEAEDIQKDIAELLDIDLQDDDSVIAYVDQQEVQQIQQVQQLRKDMNNVLRKRSMDADGQLTKNVKAKVDLIDVKRSDIVPYDLTPEELIVAKKWKRYFQKVMGAMKRRVAPEGYEMVTSLYIHQKLTGQPLVCYKRPQRGRGFRLTILVDLSGSMHGYKFRQAQKLYRVLQYALAFPFVQLDVLGFNSTEKGAVNIYRYPRDAQGLGAANAGPGGITPLSHAIQVAGAGMANCKHQSHLFVLSDGMPVYRLANAKSSGRRSFVHTGMLMNWTADAVKELQRQQVSTYCFMIGSSPGYDIPSEEHLTKMFGRKWSHVTSDNMYERSFEFIRTKFVQYLRSR
jgi:hypothetical protein